MGEYATYDGAIQLVGNIYLCLESGETIEYALNETIRKANAPNDSLPDSEHTVLNTLGNESVNAEISKASTSADNSPSMCLQDNSLILQPPDLTKELSDFSTSQKRYERQENDDHNGFEDDGVDDEGDKTIEYRVYIDSDENEGQEF